MGNVLTHRRQVLRGITAAGALAGVAPVRAFAASKTFKVGIVAPQTGPLAFFYEQFPFALDAVRKTIGPTVSIGGTPHSIEFILKDSQSSPNRAAEVAQDLILNDAVDIMLAFATPATVNPVADHCELNSVPCLTNDTPLESYFFGRGGDPKVGFDWTYHFSFSGADMIASWESTWSKLPIEKKVGLLFPNDPDGINMSKVLLATASSLRIATEDAGRFDLPGGDYAAQIALFKKSGVDIVAGALTPPDFTSFWISAAQQGFKPRCVTVGKALEFPHAIEPLGSRAIGLSVGCWWDPTRPFRSGLTGQTARQLADSYEAASGKQWTMTLGDRHAILEVLVDVLKRSESSQPEALRDAIKTTDYSSIVGHINFSKGPFPNTCATPETVGQWIKGSRYPLDLVIVDNSRAPMVPLGGEPFLI
jgi:branched-chain amino acid transport system substrate-binding protein